MNPLLKLASILAPIVTLSYVLACWAWPFGACRKCHGSGKHRSPSGKYFRDCRRCKGTGRRIRTGRKVWTYFKQQHNRGTN